MDAVETLGFAAAITTIIGFAPKVLSACKKKGAGDIPWWLVFIFALDVALWAAYGCLMDSKPTVFTSAVSGLFVLALAYVKKTEKCPAL